MFNRWVQSCEFRLLIQHLFVVITDDLIEVFFHIHNIHEVAVLVELAAFDLQLQILFQGVYREHNRGRRDN